MARPSGRYFGDLPEIAERPTLFVVEGQDDAYFLDAILHEESAPVASVGIKIILGTGNLNANVSDLSKSRAWMTKQIQKVAFVLDSDEDSSAAERRVGRALQAVALPAAKHGAQTSTSSGQTIGLFLLPSGSDTGHLEKLLLSTVAGDKLATESAAFFAAHGPSMTENNRLKRVMQIYLACSPKDCRGCGRGYGLGEFNHQSPLLSDFRSFVKMMI